jgi:hypothetical protein
LKGYDLTQRAADYVKGLMNFNIDMEMSQRNTVEMGKVIARTISMNQVLDLAQKGFRKDLIEGAITILQQDITKLMSSFAFINKTSVIEDYEENSKWIDFAKV